jgi:hypothetical protein
MPQDATMARASQPKGWFVRNWKWALPSGCLLLVLLSVGGCGAFVALIMGGMKSSDAYKLALARASQSAEVTEAIGSPVEAGWWLTGKINVSGSSGQADIQFPISGPKGKATVCCQATKFAGQWQIQRLTVIVTGAGKNIDLIKPEPESSVPASSRSSVPPPPRR